MTGCRLTIVINTVINDIKIHDITTFKRNPMTAITVYFIITDDVIQVFNRRIAVIHIDTVFSVFINMIAG